MSFLEQLIELGSNNALYQLKYWLSWSNDKIFLRILRQNGERICQGLKISPIESPVGIRDVAKIGSRFVTMIYLVNECRQSCPSCPHLRQVVDTLFFWENSERKVYLKPIFWYFTFSFSLRKSLFFFGILCMWWVVCFEY